jgi:heat shock protein HtpX
MSNTAKTVLLLGALSGLFLTIGWTAGGETGLALALGAALLFNVGSYWFSDRVVLAMYHARPVTPDHRLHRLVERLATCAGLPCPRVYLIPTASPNAFATGRNATHAAVAATEGILDLLNDRELEGVLAHEISHIRHHDILISSLAATVAAAILLVSRFALFFGGGRNRGVGPIGMLTMLIVAPLAALIVQAAISRSREFAADQGGAELATSPDGLISALQKIERASHQRPLKANPATAHMFIIAPFAGHGVLSLFGTHPPTEVRVARLAELGASER